MPAGTGKRDRSGAPRADFYRRVLDEAEQLDFEMAAEVEGIDDEIALLRMKIKAILTNDPENLKLLMQATTAVERLVRTRYKIDKEQRKGLKEAIANVLKEVALPLGIGIGSTMNK